MDFVSIRIITGDVARLVDFYERATGVPATWATEDFAELRTARRHPRDRQHPHRPAVRARLRPPGRQPQRHPRVPRRRRGPRAPEPDRLRHGLRQRAHHDALGQPVAAVPRPRRQPRQLLHPLTRCVCPVTVRRLSVAVGAVPAVGADRAPECVRDGSEGEVRDDGCGGGVGWGRGRDGRARLERRPDDEWGVCGHHDRGR